MKVIKFGGSSLADAKQIKKVCEIVLADKERRAVVVSAPGKRFDGDTKVTDLLISLAKAGRNSENWKDELDAVVSRFDEIAKGLGLDRRIVKDIRNDLLVRVTNKDLSDAKYLDLLKAAGEDNCAKIVAEYFNNLGVAAEYINPKIAGMLLSDEFGNARVLPVSYDLLSSLKEHKKLIVFPGFFGASPAGDIVTFSRGGSDVTGGILAAALDADVYENFTDVDFVFAANPKVVDNPKPIKYFTFEEMRELSYMGFSVLHEDALEPVFRKNISVNIRNTNNPDSPGTMIVSDDDPNYPPMKDTPVVGIAADKGFMTIHVYKYMLNREIGFGRRLLQIIEEEGISYEHTPSGIDSISIVLKECYCNDAQLDRIIKKIYSELKVDTIKVERNMAIVMIVGRGMVRNVGISCRATSALAKANINIRMINQGSSEVGIMFGVDESRKDDSIRALYDEFFKEERS